MYAAENGGVEQVQRPQRSADEISSSPPINFPELKRFQPTKPSPKIIICVHDLSSKLTSVTCN